jgi:hypothetical protein
MATITAGTRPRWRRRRRLTKGARTKLNRIERTMGNEDLAPEIEGGDRHHRDGERHQAGKARRLGGGNRRLRRLEGGGHNSHESILGPTGASAIGPEGNVRAGRMIQGAAFRRQ